MEQLISIIIPIYNAEESIDRCINAIRGQSYKNIEIILINDGSTDQSLRICHKHGLEDSRIIIIDQKNKGVSSARNTGLNIAKGDYVMFCDSDDWPERHWCRELIAHYREDCLVMCGYYIEGKQTYLSYEVKADTEGEWIKREDYYKLNRLGIKVPWNKIFVRKIIEKHHIRFDCRLTKGEDYLFVLQYLDKISGDIFFMDTCLYHYEWPGEHSLSRKVTEDYFEQICLLSTKIFELAERIGLKERNGLTHLNTDFAFEFEKVIITILNSDKLGIREKLKRMRHVMSSNEYQRCANDVKISTNRIYNFLFHLKTGMGLWLWYLASMIKGK